MVDLTGIELHATAMNKGKRCSECAVCNWPKTFMVKTPCYCLLLRCECLVSVKSQCIPQHEPLRHQESPEFLYCDLVMLSCDIRTGQECDVRTNTRSDSIFCHTVYVWLLLQTRVLIEEPTIAKCSSSWGGTCRQLYSSVRYTWLRWVHTKQWGGDSETQPLSCGVLSCTSHAHTPSRMRVPCSLSLWPAPQSCDHKTL